MPAHDYAPPVDKLLSLGGPDDFEEAHGEWRNYLELGFGPENIPELIQLVNDESLRSDEAADNEYYAHIHAWRVLGQLHAAQAAGPLTRLFATADSNDFVFDDLLIAFGLIGPAAIPALKAYMAEHASEEADSADIAPVALEHIAEQYPEVRDECVAVLVEQLSKYNENTVTLNSIIIGELLDLEAVEAAPMIKAAHVAKRVDLMVNGTWQDVRDEFGLDPSVEIPGPEPVEEPLRPMFPFFVPSAAKNRTKSPAQRKAKAKRKQEKQSRKRNRKR